MESLPFAKEDDSTLKSYAPDHSDILPHLTASEQIKGYGPQQRTTFFTLPPEIRFQVYRHLIVSPDNDPVTVLPQHSTYRLYLRLVSHLISSRNPGLFAVAHELAEIFWTENRFVVQGRHVGHAQPLIRYASTSRHFLDRDLDWNRSWMRQDVELQWNYWCRLFLRFAEIKIPLYATKQLRDSAGKPGDHRLGPPWKSDSTDLRFLSSFPGLREVTLTFVWTIHLPSFDQRRMEQRLAHMLAEFGICKDGILVGTRIRCAIKVVEELSPFWEAERRRMQSQLVVYHQPQQEAIVDFEF